MFCVILASGAHRQSLAFGFQRIAFVTQLTFSVYLSVSRARLQHNSHDEELGATVQDNLAKTA
eukprot:86396-Chlamydomonas_euryale.AAC.18